MGCAIEVHKELGPGLMESVYEKCLIHELKLRTHEVRSQIVIPVIYKGLNLDANLKLDLLVDELIIVELKAIETIHPVFEAQLLSYLQLMKLPQGVLINFFSKNIKDSVRPLVNDFLRALPDF